MRIPLDRDNALPLYQQIHAYLADQIRAGRLAPDTRLPASRDLAASVGVSRLTVTNAYAELEAQGLAYSISRDGIYVAPVAPVDTPAEDDLPSIPNLPTWQAQARASAWVSASLQLDRQIASVSHPDLISFAQGGGDSRLFPLPDFQRALQSVLRRSGREALGYGESAGFAPLRETIAQILAGQGIPATAGQVLITAGSQQALDLVARMLLRPGDTVLAESPTHMGFIDLCRSLDVGLVAVPVDDQGMQVERVEELLNIFRPRLIYTVPNFQNPTGTCLNSIRRRQLVALAEQYQVPILEDDFVGDLRYKGAGQPALKAFDRAGMVIYVGTFSKMLMPSLRVGYLVAEGPVYEQLLTVKHTSDVATSNLMQRALEEYISVGRYQACLRQARRIFGRRRDAMLAALARYMPEGTRWTTPQGGVFVWLQLPDGISADALFPAAAQAGVIYAPGDYFFPRDPDPSCLRLNFARQPVEVIEEGIRRLGSVLRSP